LVKRNSAGHVARQQYDLWVATIHLTSLT
jgi:hypothetical protein